MVNNSENGLNKIFHAMSDPTRRAMVSKLVQGDCNVSDLPNPFSVSKAAISKHLKVLAEADLVKKRKDGRLTHCSANPRALDPALKMLEELGQFWRDRLESLDRYFSENLLKETKNDQSKTRNKKSNKS